MFFNRSPKSCLIESKKDLQPSQVFANVSNVILLLLLIYKIIIYEGQQEEAEPCL